MSGTSTSLFQMLRDGGWAMLPLGLLSMTLCALILNAWLQTTRAAFAATPSRWFNLPVRLRFLQAQQENIGSDPESFIGSVESRTLRSIQYLNVIATIAPMVGLLGTVSGMIGAFQTIALGGMGKPELLAGDIGEALITTATGLTIGIPAMIFYFVLRNRMDGRIEELQAWLESREPALRLPDAADACSTPAREIPKTREHPADQ